MSGALPAVMPALPFGIEPESHTGKHGARLGGKIEVTLVKQVFCDDFVADQPDTVGGRLLRTRISAVWISSGYCLVA